MMRAMLRAHTVLSLALVTLAACYGGSSTAPAEASSSGAEASEASPESYSPGQGETAYGVYLATVAPGEGDQVAALMAELEAEGLHGGSGELSCDRGAAGVLGLDESTVVVSVSFRTREEAERYAASRDTPPLGVAEFVAYCRD